MRGRSTDNSRRLTRALLYALLACTAVMIIVPLLFILVNSFKSVDAFNQNVFSLPRPLELGNYPLAWRQGNLFRLGLNSVVITSVSVAALISLGTLASFPISRRKLVGTSLIYVVFLSGLMIPAQVIAIPLFILERKLRLIDSLGGLVFVNIAAQLPITIFIFVGFMRGIPVELEEAAFLDGCGDARIIRSVVFPLLRPAVATVTILTALNIWNDFFYPLILIMTPQKATVTFGLFAFKSFFRVTFPNLFAYMSSMLIPIIALYLLLQKQFISGITAGAVKG
jgi:raffinose/stachyose/melibiose transport system permease protein